MRAPVPCSRRDCLNVVVGVVIGSFLHFLVHLEPFVNHDYVHHLIQKSPLNPLVGNQLQYRTLSMRKPERMHNNELSPGQRPPRVLCWVMTHEANHDSKAAAVWETWGPRCDRLLFFSNADNASMNIIRILEGVDTYETLTRKTFRAFHYIAQRFLDDYDWFLKADDDTYIVMENLRLLVQDYDPEDPVYLGHLFRVFVRGGRGYHSGGAGYVVSREALRRFLKGYETECDIGNPVEDLAFGKCMKSLGVEPTNTLDEYGKTRFHCLHIDEHVNSDLPDWYFEYDEYGLTGRHNMSDYAVSFHYVTPDEMRTLDYLIYQLRLYRGDTSHDPTRGITRDSFPEA